MDTAIKRRVSRVQKEFKKAVRITKLHTDVLRKFSEFETPEAIRNWLAGAPHFKKCSIKRVKELRDESMELLEAERKAAGRSLFMRILDKNHMMQEALVDQIVRTSGVGPNLRAIETMARLLDQEMKILQYDRGNVPDTDQPIEDYTATLLVKIQKINETRTPVIIEATAVNYDARNVPAETFLPALPPVPSGNHP